MNLSNVFVSGNNLESTLSLLGNESRLIATPWSRIVRGLGLGQHPTFYSEELSNWVLTAFDELKKKTEYKNNYVNFSSLLCDLISILVNPKKSLSDSEKLEYIYNIIFLIGSEVDPYRRVMQYSITVDSLMKLNINLFDLLEGIFDLPVLMFNSVEEIRSDSIKDENSGKHGQYEKLSAYTSVFFALAVCGKADYVVNGGRNHIDDALKILDEVPSPFFRGRGSSMLFIAISLLGYAGDLYLGDRDYIAEMFDCLDSSESIDVNPSFPQSMTPEFVKIYPLLTLLNAVAVTGHRKLLTYRQDRIAQASNLLSALTSVERTHMGLYYIMALFNLGLIEKERGSVLSLLEDLITTANVIVPSENYFLHGIACSYVIEAAAFTGNQHLVSEHLINAIADSFFYMNESVEDEVNRPYPFAYALTALGEIGCVNKLFASSSCYGNKSATSWVISEVTNFLDGDDGRLYMLNHALLNLMLRMRGNNFPEVRVYKDFVFS